MFRPQSVIIIALAIAAAIALLASCSSDSPPNKPITIPTNGISDQIWVNTCRNYMGNYVYDICTDSAAKAACLEFGFDSTINHICSTQTCDSVTRVFMIAVTCWKASPSPARPLPDTLVDSVVHLTDFNR